jgi:hypothetical protein
MMRTKCELQTLQQVMSGESNGIFSKKGKTVVLNQGREAGRN